MSHIPTPAGAVYFPCETRKTMEKTAAMSEAWVLPVVASDACTGCGECVARCPAGAVEMADGKVHFRASESCTYCGVCEDVCPEGAVALYFEVSLGERESPAA